MLCVLCVLCVLTNGEESDIPALFAAVPWLFDNWYWSIHATQRACLFCFVLFVVQRCSACFVLFCFVLFCFVLFCFVLFCFVFGFVFF
jgi:hypothetical protein